MNFSHFNYLLVICLCLFSVPLTSTAVTDGYAVLLRQGTQNIVGYVELRLRNELLNITGQVFGLEPGLKGFHIHEFGDLSNGCSSMGGHYNPDGHSHASPKDLERHSGDLGNIEADVTGIARINIEDSVLGSRGLEAILGRGIVVHEKNDDLGRGPRDSDTKKTGNAGARYACGVIALAKQRPILPPQAKRSQGRKS